MGGTLSGMSITHESGLEATMRDGTVLRGDAWRPSAPGKYPVILMRLPYDKLQGEDLCYAHPSWYARRGFAVVTQDVRGRWRSDGDFIPFAWEADDGEDTIEWAVDLPFSNGRVGMYGFSYAGATQLQLGVRRPEGLRCLCPAMTSPGYYEGWAYNNGAFSLAFNASWATFLANDVARRRDSALEAQLAAQYAQLPSLYWILPLSAFPNLGREEVGGFFQDWLGHETKDQYWRQWEIAERLVEMDVGVLCAAGLYDIFLEGTLATYRAVRSGPRARDARLLIGPWYHMPWMPAFGALDFGAEGKNSVDHAQLEHFDQWLRDGDEPEGARVRAFITGADHWEGFDDWPPPTTPWTLHLRAGSRANSLSGDGSLSDEEPGLEDPDVFTYDPASPVPSLGGRSCCLDFVAPMGPADQRPVESLNSVLVYSSDRLERDRLVAGTVLMHLFAVTSAPDTDWTVKVCDVYPDGRSINIQESIQRARFARGTDQSRPIPPGELTEFAIEVGSLSHLFRSGHRIRVEVSSSNFPHWDRNLNTGHPVGTDSLSDRVVGLQTVLHDSDHPSRIVLPLVE